MVDVEDAAVVAILTRAPGRGGKSRLFAELQIDPDPALLTALLLDTLDAADVPAARRVIAVDPADACDEVRAILPRDVGVMPQHGGTLGDRMRLLMEELFSRGARSVVIVGSDLPDLQARALHDAFARLDDDPSTVIVGPATDGGYYLIGAAARLPPVFDGISWGTGDVLTQTLAAAAGHGVRVAFVEPLADVDTVADLRRVKAPRTREWIRANLREE
jgi:rSAM/selenodomain-associated transferase 1